MSLVSFLSDYEKVIADTDKLGDDAGHLITFGLFGEVGSILSISKKDKRGEAAFDRDYALIEELGDALWYFCRLCHRCGVSISSVAGIYTQAKNYQLAPTGIKNHPLALVPANSVGTVLEASKILGGQVAKLLTLKLEELQSTDLSGFFNAYMVLVSVSGVSFQEVIEFNIRKSTGRFAPLVLAKLPSFDEFEHVDERLPGQFKIQVTQRSNGRTYLKKNGVFIGDPLTDNIAIEDGYRFHDVFHMSYAAILHWSPVFRALLKLKRKGNPEKDESEDGGRAIVIEEGISAWIFSIAKQNNYFEGQTSLSFDILKTVKQFVRGYEVERCPYSLFDRAILEGYKVFRDLKKHGAGVIIGDRSSRTIAFEPLEPKL
ncbi:nucleoside triphosphate pyrophosphohydrolase family protein [Ectopseudomonas chengduensis]|nr:nucleoside triphosphate pyrophosphohydrolase family protein [Pseudomonas chengduensis]WKC35389.1 nucleoside triphosphate pyrophosphohydrolase family protein [Pseudomonas chengduensis]